MITFFNCIRAWFYQRFDTPIGIALISCFFGVSSIFELSIGIRSIGAKTGLALLYLEIPICTLFSCFGLVFKKGWAWNFAILTNSYIFFFGVLDAFQQYFHVETTGDTKKLILTILFNVAIHVSIYFYLLQKEIKKLYPHSNASLIIIGFFLMSIIMIDYSNNIPNFFKILLFIMGLAITIKGEQNKRTNI